MIHTSPFSPNNAPPSQEFVTELYLAESDKKRDQLWTRIEKAMANLGVPKKIAQHLLEKRKPVFRNK